MSIRIMDRIWWREDLPTMEKFVGIALGDAANDEGMCWPTVETIARKCSCSDRTVQKALKGLEGKGLLRRVQRKDRSSYYIFNMDNLPSVDRPRRPKELGPADAAATPEEYSPDLFGTGESGTATGEPGTLTPEEYSPRTVNEPSLEPSSMSDAAITELWVARWNALADQVEAIKPITRLGDKRRASLLARVDEYEPARDSDRVAALLDRVLATIRGSRFLRGEKADFKADPAWATTPTYFPKLEETGYAQDTAPGAGRPDTPRGRSHVAAGQAARDVLHAGGTATRRSARQLAGGAS